MQGKCRIYTAYTIVTLIGVFIFILLIFFIEMKINKNITQTPQTTKSNINKENEILTSEVENDIEDFNKPVNLINNMNDVETKEENNIYKVNTDILNIRNNPNIKSNIIKKYIRGDNIVIININNKWGELKSGGYAYMDFLEKNDDLEAHLASDEGITIYKVISTTINIREEPNMLSNIIKKMAKNEKVYIERIEGEWGAVLGGGFVYMELLKKDI